MQNEKPKDFQFCIAESQPNFAKAKCKMSAMQNEKPKDFQFCIALVLYFPKKAGGRRFPASCKYPMRVNFTTLGSIVPQPVTYALRECL